MEHVERELREEFEFLEHMSASVWLRIAASYDNMTPNALRSATLNAAHVLYAYLSRLTIKPLTSWPWCLARGDIRGNLEALRALPEAPSDDTATIQIKEMLDIGSPDQTQR